MDSYRCNVSQRLPGAMALASDFYYDTCYFCECGHAYIPYVHVHGCTSCHILEKLSGAWGYGVGELALLSRLTTPSAGFLALECLRGRHAGIFMTQKISLFQPRAPPARPCETLHWDYKSMDALFGIAVRVVRVLVRDKRMIASTSATTFTSELPADLQNYKGYLAYEAGIKHPTRRSAGMAIILGPGNPVGRALVSRHIHFIPVNMSQYACGGAYNTQKYILEILGGLQHTGYLAASENLQKLARSVKYYMDTYTARDHNVWGFSRADFA